MIGTIDSIILDRGFGFIRVPDSADVFFHRLDLDGIDFEESLVELVVEFDVRETPRGLRASSIRPA